MNSSKAHIDYWKSKLRKQKLPRTEWETSGTHLNWEIYLQVRGHREWFNLGTPNKDAAAKRARDIYQTCKGGHDGWERTREHYKPEAVRLAKLPTVGEFLAAVEKHTTLNAATLHS